MCDFTSSPCRNAKLPLVAWLGIAAEIAVIPNRCDLKSLSGLDFKLLALWASEGGDKFEATLLSLGGLRSCLHKTPITEARFSRSRIHTSLCMQCLQLECSKRSIVRQGLCGRPHGHFTVATG